ncbi:hypothetical protein ABZ357_37335 [Streptomyces sp. NPDC005917]|uniref:hypothetical protein n=1 Tax=unclassified Streptomyces TaxID=2593676 RepID=UPI003400773B
MSHHVVGETAHPSVNWVTGPPGHLVMDLRYAFVTVTHLIRDRDSTHPEPFRV